MNRSSILRISGILAAVAFTLTFLTNVFLNLLGGFTLLSRFGLDSKAIGMFCSGEYLVFSVLTTAAFVILAMDKENLAAGLIGAIQAGISCVLAFASMSGASNYWPLVSIALSVMFFISVVLIKNNVPRTLRTLVIVAAVYSLVSRLAWQGVNAYQRSCGVSPAEMKVVYDVLRFFTLLPGMMCAVALIVYFVAQACTSNRCQAAFDEGAASPSTSEA